jgi:hypothetical protein
MSHLKFQLDQTVTHLHKIIPAKRVATNKSLGLDESASDEQIVEEASFRGNIIVTTNTKRHDFENAIRERVSQSSKKPNGCTKVNGLILLLSNDEIVQQRLWKGLENRLFFEGKKISFQDVHDLGLMVKVQSTGQATISRLPRCPHCVHDDERDRK